MNMIVNQAGQVSEVSNNAIGAAIDAVATKQASEASVRLAARALQQIPEEFKIGQIVTCQYGNPGDTNWKEETHANVPSIVVDKQRCEVTFRMYYLVAKVDDREYVARASDSRGSESISGEMYTTNARTFGSKAAKWTGIETFFDATRSLGFKLPIHDAAFNEQRINQVGHDAAVQILGQHFDELKADAEVQGNIVLRDVWKNDFAEKLAIINALPITE